MPFLEASIQQRLVNKIRTNQSNLWGEVNVSHNWCLAAWPKEIEMTSDTKYDSNSNDYIVLTYEVHSITTKELFKYSKVKQIQDMCKAGQAHLFQEASS